MMMNKLQHRGITGPLTNLTLLSTSSDRTSASNSERIVPIKLTHSSSSSSVNVRPSSYSSSKPPASSSKSNTSNSRWSHHSVGSLPSRNDHHNQRSSSSTASGVLERKSSFPSVATGQTTRSIPIVRTGNVLKSIEKFEGSPSGSGRDSHSSFISRQSSYASPSAGARSSSIYNINANKPPTRTTGGSLGYSKLMNKSFSSFPSSNGSRFADYYDQHLKGCNSSLMTQSVDRPSFNLTRVWSGSSIQVPESSSTHSSRFISRNL
uniref:Uncharacterized protein n=1 Tax=Romanomermis culicivorax TaxID=13658 RepID=A0A915JHT6_ROMCU